MEAKDIQNILSIGCGVIAQHIITQCALHHCNVTVYVRNAQERAACVHGMRDHVLARLIERAFITREEAAAAQARVRYIDRPPDTPEDIQLVTESVLESVEIKREIWTIFAPYLPKNAILTSNTSTLKTSDFCRCSGAPERFLAWHFAAPVYEKNIADIMPHPGTAPEHVETMVEFSRRLHLNPVVLRREVGGYLANNLLSPVLAAALELYHDGFADFQEIDRSWMIVREENEGPFAIMDKIGLDTMILAMRDRVSRPAVLAPLEVRVARGDLGVKSGKGFYTYPNPSFRQAGVIYRAMPLLQEQADSKPETKAGCKE